MQGQEDLGRCEVWVAQEGPRDEVGPLLTVTEDDGAEDKAAGDERTNHERDTKDDAL